MVGSEGGAEAVIAEPMPISIAVGQDFLGSRNLVHLVNCHRNSSLCR
jgi:hypothetical protein